MKVTSPIVAVLALNGLSACSDDEANKPEGALEVKKPASAEQLKMCNQAKNAALAAREVYNNDYEARNPDFESVKLTLSEFNACRLAAEGAFVGKWRGQRWRFVPFDGEKYSEDPRHVWVSDEPAPGESRAWFSEWRSADAGAERGKQLDLLLASSEVVE